VNELVFAAASAAYNMRDLLFVSRSTIHFTYMLA
jgi:hypothetical protein